MRSILIALVPLALIACSEASSPMAETNGPVGITGAPVEQEIAEGREIASHQCANCHGLDKEDALRADAPALRNVLANYDGDALKLNFESGLKVGHPDMPEFVFGPLGADVLLVYLESIQEPVEAPATE